MKYTEQYIEYLQLVERYLGASSEIERVANGDERWRVSQRDALTHASRVDRKSVEDAVKSLEDRFARESRSLLAQGIEGIGLPERVHPYYTTRGFEDIVVQQNEAFQRLHSLLDEYKESIGVENVKERQRTSAIARRRAVLESQRQILEQEKGKNVRAMNSRQDMEGRGCLGAVLIMLSCIACVVAIIS